MKTYLSVLSRMAGAIMVPSWQKADKNFPFFAEILNFNEKKRTKSTVRSVCAYLEAKVGSGVRRQASLMEEREKKMKIMQKFDTCYSNFNSHFNFSSRWMECEQSNLHENLFY